MTLDRLEQLVDDIRRTFAGRDDIIVRVNQVSSTCEIVVVVGCRVPGDVEVFASRSRFFSHAWLADATVARIYQELETFIVMTAYELSEHPANNTGRIE